MTVARPSKEVSPSLAQDAPVAGCDLQEFGQLFASEFAHVWNTLRRLGVRPADLEDVTHEVFISLYRRRASYDPTRPFGPWLFAFCFRSASEYRRRLRKGETVLSDVEPIDEAPLADELLAAGDDVTLVDAALGRLDLDRRAVLVMHDMEECTVPQIAEALAIPVNTAYSRLRSAREQFTKAVDRLRRRRDEP
jgi:RNA polymerase sigma-70 factor (ECF subfamily)